MASNRDNDIEGLLRRAAATLQQGDGEGAARLAETALRQAPDHPAALHMRGAIALQLGRPTDALPLLRKAVAAGAGPGALANLGIAAAQAGEHAEGEAAMRKAAESGAGNPQLAYNLGHLLQQTGRHEEAEIWLRQATAQAPGYVRAWCDLGALLLEQGREDEAEACFDAALKADSDQPVALYNKALLDQRRGRHAEACAGYARCRGRLPLTRGLALGHGACLQELGRMEEALVLYRELLAKDRAAYPHVLRNITTASKGLLDTRPSRMRALLGID